MKQGEIHPLSLPGPEDRIHSILLNNPHICRKIACISGNIGLKSV
jgi:hypothetical protein